MAALPAFGLISYMSWAQHVRAHQDAARDAEQLAREAAREQDAVLARARELLLALSQSLALASPESEKRCPALLKGALKIYPYLANVGLIGPRGTLRCSAVPFEKAVNLADRPYFSRALASGKFAIGDYQIGRVTHKATINVAQPVFDKRSRATGVLFAAIDLSWLQQLLQRSPLPRGSVILAIDDAGTVLARYPDGARWVGRRLPSESRLQSVARAHGPTLFDSSFPDGIQRVNAIVPLLRGPGGDPVYVQVGLAQQRLYDRIFSLWTENIALMAVATLVVLALAWWYASRYILRQVGEMTLAARRLAGGDFSARAGSSRATDELGMLARTFDSMAEGLQSRERQLDRVNRTLRTLSAGNRALLREHEEESLLGEMCRVAVQVGSFPLAFVCYAQDDERKTVDIVARSGRDDGLLDTLAMTWADTERGRGSVGNAIRSGQTAFVRDIASDSAAAPWREAILGRGFASVVSLPLRVEGRIIGTFTLFATESDAFGADEVALLDEMAADLSFGIETIRRRARQRETERAIEHAATHYVLTGLPNRGAFVRRTDDALRTAAENGEPAAVLVGHLANLQDLYDGLGYDPGNKVVRELADRLRAQNGSEDMLGHLQPNDFGQLLRGGDAARAQAAALEMRRALTAPVAVGDAQIEVQAAVGASFYPGHGDDPELLVRRAAITAREAARRDLPYLAYEGVTSRENPARLALAGELRKAIDARALILHYQSKHLLSDNTTAGAEALVRWDRGERGFVSPAVFVPMAEQTGLIRPLTYLVADLAVRQLHAWNQAGTPVAVAINLSARNLFDPQLIPWIRGLLNTWGVPGHLLDYEITEGALVEDPGGARRVLEDLASLGGRIYIDDFGTGYSSLSYLVKLPVHALKIDRSFVAQMSTSEQARAVVQSVVSMAHALGLRVVAEGVETEAEAAVLRQFGCDAGQGYLLAKPLAPDAFTQRLARRGGR